MPRRGRSGVCAQDGCPASVPAGTTYCREHAAERERAVRLASDWRWVYQHPRWRGLRRRVRREQTTCAVDGCLELWTDLDHIRPVREILAEGGDPFDRENVQGLCKAHHSEKTAREVWHR